MYGLHNTSQVITERPGSDYLQPHSAPPPVVHQCFILLSCFSASGPPTLSPKIYATRGSNITLPCRLHHDTGILGFGNIGLRVKWTKVTEDDSVEEDVLVSMGFHKKSFGSYNGRVRLVEADENDASLMISDISLNDMGTYRCEVINGMEDRIQEVTLEVQGSIGRSDGKSSLLFFLNISLAPQLSDGHHLISCHLIPSHLIP